MVKCGCKISLGEAGERWSVWKRFKCLLSSCVPATLTTSTSRALRNGYDTGDDTGDDSGYETITSDADSDQQSANEPHGVDSPCCENQHQGGDASDFQGGDVGTGGPGDGPVGMQINPVPEIQVAMSGGEIRIGINTQRRGASSPHGAYQGGGASDYDPPPPYTNEVAGANSLGGGSGGGGPGVGPGSHGSSQSRAQAQFGQTTPRQRWRRTGGGLQINQAQQMHVQQSRGQGQLWQSSMGGGYAAIRRRPTLAFLLSLPPGDDSHFSAAALELLNSQLLARDQRN